MFIDLPRILSKIALIAVYTFENCLVLIGMLHTLKEETFASEKIREIFGINFRELAACAFLARINFREFMI